MATKPFNPLDYGAKAVATSSPAKAFDPAALGAVPVAPPQAPVKKDGIVSSIGKDVFNTLVATPGRRFGEAVGSVIGRAVGISPATLQERAAQDINFPSPFGEITVKGQKQLGSGGATQIAGNAAKSAAYLFPYGKVAEGVAGAAAPIVGATAGKGVGGLVSGGTGGYLADVGINADEGKTGAAAFSPGAGTALGLAIPGAGIIGRIAGKSGNALAPKFINSLIKPLSKDLSYGKNPGKTIAELGITGNSLEDLGKNVSAGKQKIGEVLGQLAQSVPPSVRLNLAPALTTFDESIKKAVQNNDQALVSRLTNAKDAITHIFRLDDGKVVPTGSRILDNLSYEEALTIKQIIGGLTKWTGQHTEDETANKALTRAYGIVKGALDTSAEQAGPEVAAKIRALNSQYADLTSAESAIKHRAAVETRQNVVNLPGKIGLGISAVAAPFTGGLFTVVGALSSFALDKILSSAAFKSRIAALLAKSTPEELNVLRTANPGVFDKLKSTFGDFQFPGDTAFQGKNRASTALNTASEPLTAPQMNPVSPNSTSKYPNIPQGAAISNRSLSTDAASSIDGSVPQVAEPVNVPPVDGGPGPIAPQGKISPGALLGVGGAAVGLAGPSINKQVGKLVDGLQVPSNNAQTTPAIAPMRPVAAPEQKTLSPEVIAPSAHLAPVIDQVSNATSTPPAVLKAILLMESSMAYDNSNQNPKIGKYAWLAGLTNTAKADLKKAGIQADFNTREGAVKAAADFWNLLQKRYPNETPEEIYFKHYYAGPNDTPQRRALFKKALDEYAP